MAEQTVGQQRVRADFNPSADSVVDQIKSQSAALIDLCETLKAKDARLASLAQTSYEEAAMWAVKAETTPAPDSAASTSAVAPSDASSESNDEATTGEDEEKA